MKTPDPELEGLFPDPADQEVVELLSESRPGPPPLDPYFRNHLRLKLIAEARRTLARPARGSWLNWPPLPATLAVAAGFAIVFLAGLYSMARHAQPTGIQVISALDKKDVATAEPIRIDFKGPVDKNAVAQTVEIQPAAQYATRWEGQTLVITPLHPLAPNTGYTVKVEPTAGQPAAERAPQTAAPPVVVRLVTAPSPVPLVRPPSYEAGNLTFLGESRIADPGTFGTAVWTPDGQALVVTRPTSETIIPRASASPDATAQSTRPIVVTDAWLMSPQGTFVRRLAPRASNPAVAPSGSSIAYWRVESATEASLQVSALDDDGSHAVKVTTVGTPPDRSPVWVGSDRLAYVDGGQLRVVDLRGAVNPGLKFNVSGSLAASPDGKSLALETPNGPALYDIGASAQSPLPTGASKFSWSARGDLAFVVSQTAVVQLWILPHEKKEPLLRVPSPGANVWSDISWAPDSAALLFVSRPTGADTDALSRAFLVNVEGKNELIPFGSNQREYTAPRWSPLGTAVIFTRRDETGRPALWSAGVRVGQLSAADQAQLDAQSQVDRFMRARLDGKLSDAQAELGPEALAKYKATDRPLAGSQNPVFARYYPVGVQLVAPDKFLVGVRIVLADPKSKQETSFFEEHLTVVRHDQRFRIDAVDIGKTIRLGQGPGVVSVELRQSGSSTGDASRLQLLVRFDADLDPATVSKDSVFVQDADGNRIKPVVFNFDQARHLVTLTLPGLQAGNYQLVVSTAVADFRGRTLEEDYQWPLVVAE